MNWFNELSIRWKFQIGFFLVTAVTTIYNRILASYELQKMVDIARQGGAAETIVRSMAESRASFHLNSLWETGIEFALQFMLIAFVARLFLKPILRLCEALKAVEHGDLTRGVEVTAKDEIGVVQRDFNDVIGKLSGILGRVEDSGKHMAQSAFQIATISQEIADVSRQEQNRSSEVSAETQSLIEMARTVAAQATSAAAMTRQVAASGQNGVLAVQRNIAGMEATAAEVSRVSTEVAGLSEVAGSIAGVIGTIREIAGQTNLLALNAAIEAARAGEAGRGFAVVADEVRKLADRTNRSALEVTAMVERISGAVGQVSTAMAVVVDKVEQSQQVAGETGHAIEGMAADVSGAATASEAIVEASRQQMQQLTSLEQTLEGLFVTLRTSSAKVDTTAAIGAGLHRVTADLNQMMTGFQFRRETTTLSREPSDHRRHPRLKRGILVRADQGDGEFEALVSDLSLSGVRLTIPHLLVEGKKVNVKLFMPVDSIDDYTRQKPLALAAALRWQRQEGDRLRCGLEFQTVDAAQRAQLKKIFDYYNLAAEYAK